MGLFGIDSASSNQTATNQQAATQGGGPSSTNLTVGGGGSAANVASNGGTILGGRNTVQKGGVLNYTVNNSDADVVKAAIYSNTQIADDALKNVGAAVTATEQFAGEYAQGLLAATQSAQTVANNVASGTAQPILAGSVYDPYAHDPQPATGVSVTTIVTLIAGLIAIFAFLRKP